MIIEIDLGRVTFRNKKKNERSIEIIRKDG